MKKIITLGLVFLGLSTSIFANYISSFEQSEGLQRVLIAADTTNVFFLAPKKYAFLNSEKVAVFTIEAEYASDFKNGVAKVKQKGKFGFINKEGKFVIQPKYSTVGDVAEGVVVVGDSADQFNKVISLKDSLIANFEKPIKVGSSFNGEGIDGGFVITTENIHNYAFSEGLINIENRFFNLSGKLAFTVPGKSGNCINGFIVFEVANAGSSKYGYVDNTGKPVITPKYDYAESFHTASTVVGNFDGGWKYFEVDKTGKVIRFIGNSLHLHHPKAAHIPYTRQTNKPKRTTKKKVKVVKKETKTISKK